MMRKRKFGGFHPDYPNILFLSAFQDSFFSRGMLKSIYTLIS